MPLMDKATITLAAKVYALANEADIDVDGLNIEPGREFELADEESTCYCRLRLVGIMHRHFGNAGRGGDLGNFSGLVRNLLTLLTVLKAAKPATRS